MGTYYNRLVRVPGQVSQLISNPVHDVPIPNKITRMVVGDEAWVEVSLDEQALYLYMGTDIVSAFWVSTGRPGSHTRVSKATRKGIYRVYKMYKSYPMWGIDGGIGWWCPDVPFTIFFHKEFAIHGAYWHNDFGTPVSHGCVNMAEMDAGFIFSQVKKGTVIWVH